MNIKHPTALVILDGFGYSKQTEYNAIANACTPNIDTWLKQYPNTTLQAAGKTVGLLDDSIGNSQVGHLTIGAGRVIEQPVNYLDKAIDQNTFYTNEVLTKNLKKLQNGNGTLHILGLLSDAGVHSHEKHLYAFLKAAQEHGITQVFVHPFLDGRDVPPKSAKKYLAHLQEVFNQLGIGAIGSIHGRFYAMDRDNNWQRTQQTYHTLVQDQPITFHDWNELLDHYYQQGITDEFIPPTKLHTQSSIGQNDGIIFFNFRPDRALQLTSAFVDPNFKSFKTYNIPLTFFMTPFAYNSYPNVDAMYTKPPVKNTLKEVLSQNNKTIFTIAETEKYAHVTYFFGGGREQPFNGEKQILIPSIPAQNYISHPHMSAAGITHAVLDSLQKKPCDFYLINYANADMVGHSGDFSATVRAIEYLDEQLKKLYDQIVIKMNGTLYITADHGNAEDMYNKTAQQPRTAHTNNPVPFIMINNKAKGTLSTLPLNQLADIAPFILKNLGLDIPQEMKTS